MINNNKIISVFTVFIILIMHLALRSEISDYISINNTDLKSDLKIGYWSSWQIKCGIAVYTKHLHDALQKLGYKVYIYNTDISTDKLIEKIKKNKINVLNIQYEPNLMPTKKELISTINTIRLLGVKVILTIHYECDDVKDIAKSADKLIYHKSSKFFKFDNKVNFIPMGVPVFIPSDSKSNLRKKYGFNDTDIILTTAGFMAPWKQLGQTLDRLAALIKSNKNFKIQLLTSFNDNSINECRKEYNKIVSVITKHNLKNQAVHITSFLEQQELNERLWISDVGYLWANIDTPGSSAAGKEFIASRLPIITSDSTHYHDLSKGTIKTSKNLDSFINQIGYVLRSKRQILVKLREELTEMYQKLNYDNLIHAHIKIFNQ